MICSTCGTDNRDGGKFCSRCGSALPDPGPAYQSVYQQPGPGAAPYPGAMQAMPPPAYGQPIGERRDLAMAILLTLVTCGIYGLYWGYRMFGEIAADLGRTDINPVLEIVLALVTCNLYTIYLCYKYPKLINEMQMRRGMPVNDITVMTLLLAVFGLSIVSFALMQSELNKIWDVSGAR